MPRPHPPRRRPRQRRRNPALVKVPQQSPDQETEARQPAAAPPQRSARAAAVRANARAAVVDTSEWPRRTMFVLVGLAAVIEVIINLFGFAQESKTVTISNFLVVIQPIPVVLSCFVAMPLTKLIMHERRYLRIVETALVGVFIFFIWFFLAVGVGALLGGNSSPTKTNPSPQATPLPANFSPTPSAIPTPTPSAASARGASPSPSARATTTVPVQQLTSDAFAALVAIDLTAYAVTPFLFYPVYRRMRLRRPAPPTPRGAKK